jgi:hypothetical protein
VQDSYTHRLSSVFRLLAMEESPPFWAKKWYLNLMVTSACRHLRFAYLLPFPLRSKFQEKCITSFPCQLLRDPPRLRSSQRRVLYFERVERQIFYTVCRKESISFLSCSPGFHMHGRVQRFLFSECTLIDSLSAKFAYKSKGRTGWAPWIASDCQWILKGTLRERDF